MLIAAATVIILARGSEFVPLCPSGSYVNSIKTARKAPELLMPLEI